MKSFTRQCPSCQRVLKYTNVNSFRYAEKHESKCIACGRYGYSLFNTSKSRRCPICGKTIIYKTVYQKQNSDRKNRSCPSCRQRTIVFTDNLKRHCCKCGKDIFYKKWSTYSESVRKRDSVMCKSCAFVSKRYSQSNNPVRYNEKACDYLDILNGVLESKGVYFRHALNHKDGEFCYHGFFADGYDHNNNIWFEWDEKHHEQRTKKQQDLKRDAYLKSTLNPTIYKYSEKYNCLYKCNGDGSTQRIQ